MMGTYRIFLVIAGLDPAIHPLRKSLAKKMDPRVKPGGDALECATLNLTNENML
jgi:hypothetical protein